MGDPKKTGARVTIVDDEIDGFRITFSAAREIGWLAVHVVSAGAFWLPYVDMMRKGPPPWIVEPLASRLRLGMLLACSLESALVLACYLWYFRARDVVALLDRHLIVRRAFGPFSRRLTFDLNDIGALRYSPLVPSAFRTYHPHELGIGGVIAFDSGGKTYRFGLDVPEGEAQSIIERMKLAASGRQEPKCEQDDFA